MITLPEQSGTSVTEKAFRCASNQQAWRRNLRTATFLTLAFSGGFVSTSWMVATAGGMFLAITAWRYKQMQQERMNE